MPIRLTVDNVSVPIKRIQFSDGGTNIKLEVPQQLIDYPPSAYYSISVDLDTPVDNYLWEIYLTLDALRRTFKDNGKFKRILHLPYLPHGRADRVFEVGNPFPLNLFITHILLQFDEIFLTDPHSSWCQDHIPEDMLVIKTQHQCFIEVVGNKIKSGDVLIAPDKGAKPKARKIQEVLEQRGITVDLVECSKIRELTTGKILSVEVPDIGFTGRKVFIVDDIGDGMGTFIPIAEKLSDYGAASVELYLTHIIGSKGLDILKGKIDKIHTYQVVGNFINMLDINKYNEGS